MTSVVRIHPYKPIVVSSIEWASSVDNICPTAKIILPSKCVLKRGKRDFKTTETGMAIEIGSYVEIYAGYDGRNICRFKGFVARVNLKSPCEIECEGYSYMLKKSVFSMLIDKPRNVKWMLNILINATDIKLSEKIPDNIIIEPTTIKDMTGIEVINWLKENYLLTVFFRLNELYVGWRATYNIGTVKLRLNWNTIRDGNLFFGIYPKNTVYLNIASRSKDGSKKLISSTPNTNVKLHQKSKVVKTLFQDEINMKSALNDLMLNKTSSGFEGKLTCFLEPFIEPGMTVQIIDTKNPERNGRYFVDAVNGSFSTNGGRQTVSVGYRLDAPKK